MSSVLLMLEKDVDVGSDKALGAVYGDLVCYFRTPLE